MASSRGDLNVLSKETPGKHPTLRIDHFSCTWYASVHACTLVHMYGFPSQKLAHQGVSLGLGLTDVVRLSGQ